MNDFFCILMHHRLAQLLRDKPPVFRGELQRTLEYLQFGDWGNGTRVKLQSGLRSAHQSQLAAPIYCRAHTRERAAL